MLGDDVVDSGLSNPAARVALLLCFPTLALLSLLITDPRRTYSNKRLL